MEKLIRVIKEQAQIFLLDAGEFYPFGSCIDENNKIKPVGVYVEDERPSSLEVISLLENNMRIGIQNGAYKIAVIAVNVTIKENNVDRDAIEIRIFEIGNKEYKKYIKYTTYGTHIEFFIP